MTGGLLRRLRGRWRERLPLAPLTWLRTGGPARFWFQPADLDDLADFLRQRPAELAVLPLGVGSNILVRDGGFPGVVVRLGGPLATIGIEDGLLVAGAGALDQRVAREALRLGLSGLEFMIGIPGTIGGAVRMNAGAFGGETGDRLCWAEVLDPSGRLQRLSREELGFGYRRSALGEGWIVVRAAFALVPGDGTRIRARMEEIRAERERAQPLRVATGGSTFKNPPGQKAWRLIEEAGCRGLRRGRVMMSEKHCNFLVNLGGARAAEVEALGEEVRRRVERTSGIMLEWEIHRVGEPESAEAAG